jgi:hypothetical protein
VNPTRKEILMLKRLKPGDLFEMSLTEANRPINATKPPNAPDEFLHVPHRRFRLHHPKSIQTVSGPVTLSKVDTQGTSLDQVREFVWLPYIAGKISYTSLPAGLPIITGKMDGCFLVLFTMAGQQWFGHIGTELGPNTSASIQARNAWTIALGTRAITCDSAFNPVGCGAPITGDGTLGAVGSDRAFYVIDAQRGSLLLAGGGSVNTFRVNNVSRAAQVSKPRFL